MPRNSVDLIDQELSARLQHAPDEQLRQVAVAISACAVELTGLREDSIEQAVKVLLSGDRYSSALRDEVQAVVEELDLRQWDLQDLVEEGSATEESYQGAFAQARAANAVLVALDPDPFRAATEAVYEANAAIGDLEVVRQMVESVLSPP